MKFMQIMLWKSFLFVFWEISLYDNVWVDTTIVTWIELTYGITVFVMDFDRFSRINSFETMKLMRTKDMNLKLNFVYQLYLESVETIDREFKTLKINRKLLKVLLSRKFCSFLDGWLKILHTIADGHIISNRDTDCYYTTKHNKKYER